MTRRSLLALPLVALCPKLKAAELVPVRLLTPASHYGPPTGIQIVIPNCIDAQFVQNWSEFVSRWR